MEVKFAEYKGIENSCKITEESYYSFIFHLQAGLILALRDQGTLSTMQHRCAEEKLNLLRRNRVRKILEKGSGND